MHRRFVTLGFGILREVGSVLSKFFSFSSESGILYTPVRFMHNVCYGMILVLQSEQICSVFTPAVAAPAPLKPLAPPMLQRKQNLVHFVLLPLDRTR